MSRVTAVTISRLLDTVAIRIGDRLVVIPQEVCNGPISPPDEINIAIELSQVCRVAFSPMDGQRPVAMVTADVDILENAGRACLALAAAAMGSPPVAPAFYTCAPWLHVVLKFEGTEGLVGEVTASLVCHIIARDSSLYNWSSEIVYNSCKLQ